MYTSMYLHKIYSKEQIQTCCILDIIPHALADVSIRCRCHGTWVILPLCLLCCHSVKMFTIHRSSWFFVL